MGTPGLVRFPVMLQMKGGITHSELCPHWRLTRGAGDQRGTGFLFSPPSIQPPAVCGSQCWAILSQGSCLQNFPFMSAEGSALRETCAPWEPRVAPGQLCPGRRHWRRASARMWRDRGGDSDKAHPGRGGRAPECSRVPVSLRSVVGEQQETGEV